MKITVNVEDFYFDEEDYSSLDKQLKSFVVQKTKEAIWASIQEVVQKEVSEGLKAYYKKTLKRQINHRIKKYIDSGKLKDGYHGEVAIDKWIGDLFSNNRSHNSDDLKKKVNERVDYLTKQIKNRYDLHFASQFVAKINEQGLLKEGVFKAITEQQ